MKILLTVFGVYNTLENVEVHLVSIITYNENKKLEFDTETGIKNQIETIIAERYHLFDNNKIESSHDVMSSTSAVCTGRHVLCAGCKFVE